MGHNFLKVPAEEALWQPPMDGGSRLEGFMAYLSATQGLSLKDYAALHAWSVEKSKMFWDCVWDFCGVIGDKGVEISRDIPQVPWTRFFPDSKLSYTENMLSQVFKTPHAPAIIFRCQGGEDRALSWQDVCDQVSLWEQALLTRGVREGDRVAVYLPNIPETVMILLAASNIGAVFASAGMEMGVDDLVNRFGQVRPKILITQEAYTHGEKIISRADTVARVRSDIESLDDVLIIDHNFSCEALEGLSPKPLVFVRRDFNHPLYILFSSGSTGKPKCFEHGTGGVLLKHLGEFQLHCDVKEGDKVFYHATPSWMMWNWLASGLASDATILMYDGSPVCPGPYAQWDFTSAYDCTHHGTAAPVILNWLKNNLDIGGRCDLSALRVIMSTGAVLPEQGFEYVHDHIKKDVNIGSISGGTDIVGCFLGGNPIASTYAGQIKGAMLGMDVQVWDEEGDVVSPEQAGELVCLNAFPSMPLRFLDDEGGVRYKAEYFSHYDFHTQGRGVWRHGDMVVRTAQDQFKILGRSDATLNQNGVRIGPVAIYEQLKPFADQIKEAAAIDFTRPDNAQAITILFLTLSDGGSEVPEALKQGIRAAVKENVGPYSVPTEIRAVPGVLKTPNGKIAEVVMKKILSGKMIANASLYDLDLVDVYIRICRELTDKYLT